jgi:hypothetical protein
MQERCIDMQDREDPETPEPTPKPKHPGGRPPKYKAEYVDQARMLMRLGATDREVAQFFKVDPVTIYRWSLQHPKFCKALRVGKGPADDRVERSFYNRAVGYSYDSEKVFQYEGVPVIVPIVEHVPPDTGAALSWLKNRRPQKWRELKALELSTAKGKPVEVAHYTPGPELLRDFYARAEAAVADAALSEGGIDLGGPDERRAGPDSDEGTGED